MWRVVWKEESKKLSIDEWPGQLSIAFRLLLVYFSHLRLSLGLQHLATIKWTHHYQFCSGHWLRVKTGLTDRPKSLLWPNCDLSMIKQFWHLVYMEKSNRTTQENSLLWDLLAVAIEHRCELRLFHLNHVWNLTVAARKYQPEYFGGNLSLQMKRENQPPWSWKDGKPQGPAPTPKIIFLEWLHYPKLLTSYIIKAQKSSNQNHYRTSLQVSTSNNANLCADVIVW
jgi:hypothetical protein